MLNIEAIFYAKTNENKKRKGKKKKRKTKQNQTKQTHKICKPLHETVRPILELNKK